MTLLLRDERSADWEAVAALVACAFGRADEALLVTALRSAGELDLSLVADRDGEIVGHIAFQPLGVAPVGPVALSLAPVSVAPARQRQGIGSALIRAGLARAAAHGADLVFVLGDPDYYGRFGFSATLAAPWSAPWPGRHFQALRLSDRTFSGGALTYPAAFFGGLA